MVFTDPRMSEPQVDALMRLYQGAVPGACVAVLRNGAVLLRRAYGLADVEAQVAATAATNYRLASMTKQFTAAAILLLAEDGRLTIDDPVRKWLPTLPDAADGMSLRHLLTHTSGLIDYEDVIPAAWSSPLHDPDVLRLLEAQNRRYFAPGTRYRYSNGGYVLLALAAERAAGDAFAAYLRKRIFHPLGMHNTVAVENDASDIVHRAYGYSAAGDAWIRTDQTVTSRTLGDGGIYSSTDDLAKWDAALCGAGLLRPSSLRLAFDPSTPTDDPSVQYGFGWRITGATRWHSGETLGFRNVIVRFLGRRVTVIVLTNRNAPPPYRTALAIAKLFDPDAHDAANEAGAGHGDGPDPGARPLPG
jgi:CubicO group peptidase (beta-lactamase class C family)